MNKVAVLIGKDGETITFSDSGILKIFLKKDGGWEVIDEISLLIDYSMGLRNAREKFLEIAKQLGDCHIVVGKKVDGIAYNVFETMKFNIWEFDGKPQAFLDYIIDKERELAMQEEADSEHAAQGEHQETSYIKKLSNTYYVLNLEELQSAHRTISSKQALIPVLQKREFKKLDILCSHVPPWLESEIDKYQLKMETEKLCSGGYKVSLFMNEILESGGVQSENN